MHLETVSLLLLDVPSFDDLMWMRSFIYVTVVCFPPPLIYVISYSP